MLAPHISVVNLGCRVNRVESDRITADLMRLGFAMVEPQDAELIVINTCAVTGEAEVKTRKAVRHALAYPNEPYVVVTGCVVNLHPEELLELSDRVIAEPSKIDVAERVCEVLGVESDDVPACSDGEVVDALGRSRLGGEDPGRLQPSLHLLHCVEGPRPRALRAGRVRARAGSRGPGGRRARGGADGREPGRLRWQERD